jgi:hypothetical protein
VVASGGVSTGEVRPGVPVAVTCTFSCTIHAGIGGDCVDVIFTLLNVPVMFRSRNVPSAPVGADSLDEIWIAWGGSTQFVVVVLATLVLPLPALRPERESERIAELTWRSAIRITI